MLVICNNFFDDRCLFFTFLAYKKSGQNVVAPRVPIFSFVQHFDVIGDVCDPLLRRRRAILEIKITWICLFGDYLMHLIQNFHGIKDLAANITNISTISFFFNIQKYSRKSKFLSFFFLPVSFSFILFFFFFFVLWYLGVSRVPAQRIVRRNNKTFSAKCERHPIRWLDPKHLRRTTWPSSSASPGTSLLSTLIHWCTLLHWSLPLPKKGMMMMMIVAMIMTTIRIIKMTTMKIMTMMISNTYSRPVMREQIPLLRDSVERSGSRLWYLVGCWRHKKKIRHLTTIDKKSPHPLGSHTPYDWNCIKIVISSVGFGT